MAVVVRLWSLATYTCIVCYRGHNYPVWDVKFRYLTLTPYFGCGVAWFSYPHTPAVLWACILPLPLTTAPLASGARKRSSRSASSLAISRMWM